jgi:hypothetical protein
MKRYVIQHSLSKQLVCEDEGGLWLIDEDEGIFSFGSKEKADEYFNYLKENFDCNNEGVLETEDGTYPISDFEVIEI